MQTMEIIEERSRKRVRRREERKAALCLVSSEYPKSFLSTLPDFLADRSLSFSRRLISLKRCNQSMAGGAVELGGLGFTGHLLKFCFASLDANFIVL